jgi:hypothetical protein
VAIPLISEFVAAPAALSEDDQMLIVELRESDPELVALVREAEDSEVAAGGGRKGKRAEYYCAGCGYGIVVYVNLRAARCVASHAGSMSSGGPSPSCSTSLWLISHARLARACLGSPVLGISGVVAFLLFVIVTVR